MMAKEQKGFGVQSADHSKDVVLRWIWLGWRTRDELRLGVRQEKVERVGWMVKS